MRNILATLNRRIVLAGLALACLASCTTGDFLTSLYNNTASLGGEEPGQRGAVQIGFINNTDYWAVFTYGLFDPQDETHNVLQYQQFTLDPDSSLVGNTSSPTQVFTCARAIDLGTSRLLTAISEKGLQATLDTLAAGKDEDGDGVPDGGIFFYNAKLGEDPPAEPVGTAQPVSVAQGAEFACTRSPIKPGDPPSASFVLFSLDEVDGKFVVTYQVLPATSVPQE